MSEKWWLILQRWYRSKRYNLGILVGTSHDEAVFLVVVWKDWRLVFSPFLFSFTSYYRLIHNPYHLKTFLSVKLRDRAGIFSFFFFFFVGIYLCSCSFPHSMMSHCHISYWKYSIASSSQINCFIRYFGRAEVGLINLCNRKFFYIMCDHVPCKMQSAMLASKTNSAENLMIWRFLSVFTNGVKWESVV